MSYTTSQLIGTNEKAPAWAGFTVGWASGGGNSDDRSIARIDFYLANNITPSALNVLWSDGTNNSFVGKSGLIGTKVSLSLGPGELIKS